MTWRLPVATAVALLSLLVSAGVDAAEPLPPVPTYAPPSLSGPVMPDRAFLVSGQLAIGAQPSAAMKQIYGRKNPWSGELRLHYLFGERFGVGAGVGFSVRKGTGIAPADEEPPETWMWQIPVHVEGSMRLLIFREQPVVPYLRGGFDAVIWNETWPDVNGDRQGLAGVKWGVHAGGGAQFRHPIPEINKRRRQVGDPVLDDIWLHVEGWVRSADDFGRSGLDLSAAGGAIGLTLLM